MATDTRQRTTWGTRFRFLVRFVGATGVLAAAVGAALFASAFPSSSQWTVETLHDAGEGTHGEFAKAAAWTFAAGLSAVAIALVVEVIGGLVSVTGRRTAASATATVGTVAAVVLLVFVNAYSFTHHRRFDFTRSHEFTLPPELATKLRTLRSESPTTVVVLQKHTIFGTLSDDRDAFTKAAEEKVAEKVKDLVDLLRELGPRFNVAVLDTEAFGYRQQLEEVTRDAPELLEAIKEAPENSVFFHAGKRVQRLAFNEFLQLDRTASKEANGGRGNLVLLPQGIEHFARRVLAVQERRPKVAVCVVHELLTTAYPEGRGKVYTTAGLKASLTAHGFDVIDIVLKKNWNSARSMEDLKPAADTRAESALDRLEGELAAAAIKSSRARRQLKTFEDRKAAFDRVKSEPWARRKAMYEAFYRGPIAESDEADLLDNLARVTKQAEQLVTEAEADRQATAAKLEAALRDERTTEDRRIADAKAKLTQKLADVDLVIIPRLTIDDATEGDGPVVDAPLHGIRREQAEVLRDFMASGKPVLACLGPISGPDGPINDGPDEFERLLAERGIELGRETILFEGEAKAISLRLGGDQFGGGVPSDIPPLTIGSPPEPGVAPNPIAEAARLTGRSVERALLLRPRALRPVYLHDSMKGKIPFAAEFAFSAADSWNEERPFLQTELRPTADGRVVRAVTYLPQFEDIAKQDPKDPRVGTKRAERRGPFPVAVAIESKPPAHWRVPGGLPRFAAMMVGGPGTADIVAGAVANEEANRPEGKTGRIVVYGSGNLFSGPKLEPAQEKLLLHTANWLTGREDRLPRADLVAWQFPRVEMSDREFHLWRYGTAIGLPLLAVYVGLMVMMLRRLR